MSEWSGHRRGSRHGDRATLHVTALQRFIGSEAMGMAPRTRERYRRVLKHLLRYLDDVDVAAFLGTGPAALLDGERQFLRENAFFRIFGFDELVCCLEGFLEPAWLLPKRGDARSQISLVERLLKRLRRDQLIDMPIVACAYLDAERAVAEARRRLAGYGELVPGERLDPTRRPQLRVIRGGLSE